MAESTTEVIVARSSQRESLAPMLAGSVVAHAALLVIAAATLIGRASEPPPEAFMITLGGAPGTNVGGVTQIGDRAVQAAPPEPEPPPVKRPEPPPEAPPKMALPPEKEKPRPKPQTKPADAPPPAETRPEPARSVPTGPQTVAGNTPVVTGSRQPGWGISSTGGGAGANVILEMSDFCCAEYLTVMAATITRNWDQSQCTPGAMPIMKFTIRRDGTIDDIGVERTSGALLLDRAAERALIQTRLQALPDRYTNPTLTVRLRFTCQ